MTGTRETVLIPGQKDLAASFVNSEKFQLLMTIIPRELVTIAIQARFYIYRHSSMSIRLFDKNEHVNFSII